MSVPDWMADLMKEENNEYFSELCNQYFEFGMFKVLKEISKKHNVPDDDKPYLAVAVMARFFNESTYAIGACIKSGVNFNDIFSEQQQLNLLKIFNNEPLFQEERTDIETDLKKSYEKFKNFIEK